jgi:hypothetical protein
MIECPHLTTTGSVPIAGGCVFGFAACGEPLGFDDLFGFDAAGTEAVSLNFNRIGSLSFTCCS